MRLVLTALVAFVVGICAAVGGGILFASTAGGQEALRNYFTAKFLAQNSAATVTPDLFTGLPAATTTTVLVPKAYASQGYQQGLSVTIGAYNAIAADTAQLSAILLDISNRSAAGDFRVVVDQVVAAKALLAHAKASTGTFGQGLSSLGAANQMTADAITKATTLTLLTQGATLQTNFDGMWALLDDVLSSASPSNDRIAEITEKRKAIESASGAFKSTADQLIARFAEEIKRAR